VWEGFATITASTPQCSGAEGTVPGTILVSIFRPKILSTDTPTFLSAVGPRGAVDFKNTNESTVPQMHGSGNYQGFEVNNRALSTDYKGTYSLTITPAAIITLTRVVTIAGTINNVANAAGCSVTFEGEYVRRL